MCLPSYLGPLYYLRVPSDPSVVGTPSLEPGSSSGPVGTSVGPTLRSEVTRRRVSLGARPTVLLLVPRRGEG